MLINIEQIKVEKRIRKEFGDIEGLAHSIKELGLLNPPVVTPDYTLVAGERRLRALKHLGYQQIQVNVMSFEDYEHKLKAEVHENEQRKEFSFSERIEWARELEQIERLKAKDRMGQGVENFPQPHTGKSRDIVAEQTGFGSGKQFQKAKYIADNADPETIEQLDNEEISIHAAYQKVKKEKEKLEQQKQQMLSTINELKNRETEVVEVVKEIIPNHIQQELEDYKSKYNAELRNGKTLQSTLNKLHKEKQELEDYIKSDEYKALELDKQNEILKKQADQKELMAHVSISELQINIHDFITKNSGNVFLQGAVASSTFIIKADLYDSVLALEAFTNSLRNMIQRNENPIIDVTNN